MFAQITPKNASTKKTNNVGLNVDKIEVVYKAVEVTTTSRNSMGNYSSRSYTSQIPLLKINDSKDLYEIDFKGNRSLDYLKNCPIAKSEFLLGQEMWKKSKKTFLLSAGGMVVGGLTSLFIISKNEKIAVPGVIMGLSIVGGIVGVLHSYKQAAESRQKIIHSFDFYNKDCYKPKTVESEVDKKDNATTSTLGKKVTNPDLKATGFKDDKEPLNAQIVRNNPESGAFWTVALTPLNLENAGLRGLTYRIGGSLAYNVGSQYGVEASFGKAYFLDNNEFYEGEQYSPEGEFKIEQPGWWTPTYQKQSSTDVLFWKKISGKILKDDTKVDLGATTATAYGSKIIVQNVTDMNLNRYVSWNARVGVNRFVGLRNFEPTAIDPSGNVMINPFNGTPSFMTKTTSVTLGVARRTNKDYLVKIKDGDFKGKHEFTGYSQFYGDILLAASMKYDDMSYVFTKEVGNKKLVDVQLIDINTKTPKVPFGVRVGYEVNEINKIFGANYKAEIGFAPGPQALAIYYQGSISLTFGGRIAN